MGGWFDRFECNVKKLCYEMGRSPVKEACAEFLATLVFVVLGDGAVAACILTKLNVISIIVAAFGWGFGLMIAVTIAGGVSGGHVNPAVTIALATNKKCAWKKVPSIILAQYIASFLASCIVYAVYIGAINSFDGGVRQIPPSVNATAQIFATYPQEFASTTTCIVDQVLGSALLLIAICAATDSRNLRVPPHTQPLIIGMSLCSIVLAFGQNCEAPLNPARDLAPRLFTAICGWGVGVFSYRNYEWFWIPIVAPHVGAVIGVWLYKICIETPFNNYSRILEEMEDIEDSQNDRKQSSGGQQKLSEQLLTSASSEEPMEDSTSCEKENETLATCPSEKITIES